MQNRKEIVMINVANIYPHPDNPRKDVGDVTELAESIKKQGVMQNLTVIPLSALTEEPEEQPDADTESLKNEMASIYPYAKRSCTNFFKGYECKSGEITKYYVKGDLQRRCRGRISSCVKRRRKKICFFSSLEQYHQEIRP